MKPGAGNQEAVNQEAGEPRTGELRDRYFEDFTEGEQFEAGPHLMTEDAIIAFASEFDPQPFHTDPEAAKGSTFGGLIASGWHTGSVMMKLLATTLGPSSLGSAGGELRWPHPVRPGDQLTLRVTVESTRVSASKPDRGVVTCQNELINQDGTVVLVMNPVMFFRRRP
jgi:acyl dehydratase